jgi:hypothetical protein
MNRVNRNRSLDFSPTRRGVLAAQRSFPKSAQLRSFEITGVGSPQKPTEVGRNSKDFTQSPVLALSQPDRSVHSRAAG